MAIKLEQLKLQSLPYKSNQLQESGTARQKIPEGAPAVTTIDMLAERGFIEVMNGSSKRFFVKKIIASDNKGNLCLFTAAYRQTRKDRCEYFGLLRYNLNGKNGIH